MAQGWQSGERCFPTIEQAANDGCSQVFGVTNSGLLSCTSAAVVGNEVELTLSSGSVTSWTPMQCQRFDYVSTWGPLAGAILIAAVTVLCIKAIVGMFRTNHEL